MLRKLWEMLNEILWKIYENSITVENIFKILVETKYWFGFSNNLWNFPLKYTIFAIKKWKLKKFATKTCGIFKDTRNNL